MPPSFSLTLDELVFSGDGNGSANETYLDRTTSFRGGWVRYWFCQARAGMVFWINTRVGFWAGLGFRSSTPPCSVCIIYILITKAKSKHMQRHWFMACGKKDVMCLISLIILSFWTFEMQPDPTRPENRDVWSPLLRESIPLPNPVRLENLTFS